MFDNNRFFDMDEALIRVLNLLANVADISDAKKYIFDSSNYTFKLRRQKKVGSKIKSFINHAKKQFNIIKSSWGAIFIVYYGFGIVLLLIRPFILATSMKAPLSWLQILKIAWYISSSMWILIAVLVVVLQFIKTVGKIAESDKHSGRRIITKAVEDVIAYQPVIREIHAITQNNQQTIKAAEIVIKSLIEENQAREKYSYPLAVMFLVYAASVVYFVLQPQLPKQASPNDILTPQNILSVAIGVAGILILIIKSFIESGSQSQILKLRKCLFLLEQAQARANHIEQQAIPVESNKLRPQFGSAKGLVEMSDDFDDPLTDFDEYMP